MIAKKLLTGLLTAAFCVTSIVPVQAETDTLPWVSELMASSDEMANILDEIGISTTDLLEIAALPKKDESFYSSNARTRNVPPELNELVRKVNTLNAKPFKPSDYGLTNDDEINKKQVKGPYDVNPPLNEAEQQSRMQYITGIIQNEYYQNRYNDKLGKYYLYLYTSHWTENSNFDREGDNYFDKIYANIICQNDIDAFNAFYAKVQAGAVADVFEDMGNAIGTIKSAVVETPTMVDTIKESLKYTKHVLGEGAEEFADTLSDLGIDTTTAIDIGRDMTDIYKSNYKEVESAEAMINIIHDKMSPSGVTGYASKVYVDLMSSIISDVVFTGFGIPFISCGVYYLKVLSDIYPMVTLASLYYSYSIRRADRLSIYYGLFQRP